jgi:putative ABC transport system substrate-binding protein
MPLFTPLKPGRLLQYIVAGLLLLSASAGAEPLSVSVIVSETGGSYSEFSDALRANLLNSNVTFNVLDATQAAPNSGLIIAVGMKAASAVASSNAHNVLNVMIPKSGHKKLLHDAPKRENSPLYSTIYLDQPVERQLSLIAAAFPGRDRVGVLFESPPPDELYQLRESVSEHGLGLYEQEVGTKTSVFDALQNVLKHSDVLLALPVPAVYNSSSLRNILVSTYQAGIPLVGFSSAYVKAGAICAVFSSPAQFASQAGMIVRKFIETGALPSAQYPKFYEVSVNERVAHSLGININNPDELAKKISTIRRPMP